MKFFSKKKKYNLQTTQHKTQPHITKQSREHFNFINKLINYYGHSHEDAEKILKKLISKKKSEEEDKRKYNEKYTIDSNRNELQKKLLNIYKDIKNRKKLMTKNNNLLHLYEYMNRFTLNTRTKKNKTDLRSNNNSINRQNYISRELESQKKLSKNQRLNKKELSQLYNYISKYKSEFNLLNENLEFFKPQYNPPQNSGMTLDEIYNRIIEANRPNRPYTLYPNEARDSQELLNMETPLLQKRIENYKNKESQKLRKQAEILENLNQKRQAETIRLEEKQKKQFKLLRNAELKRKVRSIFNPNRIVNNIKYNNYNESSVNTNTNLIRRHSQDSGYSGNIGYSNS